ncbi:hypothetical protein BJ878DRAFT_73652 [Calycina marina]|uniref:F-box domain-containing protein n=1 Tax=Calycina marina TaxID=1763456 RepID=A0A9P7Z313_9HELO|nr:hypothetical protein BJ878DRAFT_73652 [Calycina marina]
MEGGGLPVTSAKMYPPSYEDAITTVSTLQAPSIDEVMNLVCQYIHFSDLPACSRVCKSWSTACMARLWYDPMAASSQRTQPWKLAVHFAKAYYTIRSPENKNQNREVLALVRALDFTRLAKQVCMVMGTSFDEFWHIDSCLRYNIPFLQFLILDNLNGDFDELPEESLLCPEFLLMLSVADCRMLDCTIMLNGIFMQVLVYLDMSFTKADEEFHINFKRLELPNLRILKLRGLRLTDQKLIHMIFYPSLDNLWSLDVRDNYLTDKLLTGALYRLGPSKNRLPNLHDGLEQWSLYEHPPEYEPTQLETSLAIDRHLPAAPRPDQKNDFMNYWQEHSAPGNFGVQYLGATDPLFHCSGLTHLYLSGNQFTYVGIVSYTWMSNTLQVLDIGTIKAHLDTRHMHDVPSGVKQYSMSDANRFMERRHSPELVYLRAHHSIFTCTPNLNRAGRGDGYASEFLEVAEKIGYELYTRDAARYETFLLENFGVKTLVLTDVPRKSYGFTVSRLKDLLVTCRRQEIVVQRAQRDLKGHRRAPPLLSGLRTLRLEFADPTPATAARSSISGDFYAAIFHKESLGDFSFFSRPSSSGKITPKGSALLDVVEELKAFRASIDVEENWSGKVQIVLPKEN